MLALDGFLLINKPAGISSCACIAHIKKILDLKSQRGKSKFKIGHAGTLDPFASGLLIIALGRQSTKLMPYLLMLDKEYTVTGKYGELTDTLDYTGTIIQSIDQMISLEQIKNACQKFGDNYWQAPPIYSALKYNGIALYKRARNLKESDVDLLAVAQQKKRLVNLYKLTVESVVNPYFTLTAHVSHGTYIRALVNDIGQNIGLYATTYELQRNQIGMIMLEHATDLASLKTREDVENHMIDRQEFIKKYDIKLR